MRKLLALVLVAVATLAGVYVLTKKPIPASSPQLSEEGRGNSVSDNTIAREVEDLRREIALLKTAKVMQAVERDSVFRSEKPHERSSEEIQEAQERELQQYERKLEAALRGQHRDREWARDTESKVEDAIGSRASGTKLDSVTCASSLCRVVVQHDDEVRKKEFLKTIAQAAPFAGGTFYFYDGLVTTLYIVKHGEKPPALSE